MGDLILTCTSEESRNFTFGKLLVKKGAASALKEIGQTVEGYTTAKSVPYFEKKSKINLKLGRFVYDSIKDEKNDAIKKRFLKFVEEV